MMSVTSAFRNSPLYVALLIAVSCVTQVNAEVPSEVEDKADDTTWAVVEGKLDGRVAWIRIQRGIAVADREAMPHRLTIRWKYADDGADGMPPVELKDRFWALEEALINAVRTDASGILSLVITTAGSREWHVHFSDSQAIQSSINSAFADLPDMPVSLTGNADPDWSDYRYFESALSPE